MSKRIEKIKEELANKGTLLECAEQFGVVGDATRIKICYLLCRHPELDVSSIAEALGTSISTVSHSLSKLRQLKLVERRKEAQTAYYSLTDNPFNRSLKELIS